MSASIRGGVLPWAGLLVLSLLLSLTLLHLGVPGAILVGPLLAAIGFGSAGARLQVPRLAFVVAQGFIGCLIARTVTADVLRDVAAEWHWMAFGVGATVAASAAIGFAVARWGRLPGTVAAWGSSPGAASAMVAMAEEYGADPRLVALMQYVRVICVVLTASAVARALGGATSEAAPAIPAGPDPVAVAATLAVAVAGSWLGRRFRVPAGGLLVPLAAGAALNLLGLVRMEVPSPILAAAYGIVGWYVGLQFERAVLRRALRLLPVILLSAFGTIALSAGAAYVMSLWAGHDLLTAFLATSPGGIDSVAILALDSGADPAFVMAMQTLRVLAVIAVGPPLARLIARAVPGPGVST